MIGRLGVFGAGVVALGASALGQEAWTTAEPVDASILEAPGFVVDTFHFERLNVHALLAEDAVRAANNEVSRFAVGVEVDITPGVFGSVQLLDGGRVAWRMRLEAAEATSLNFAALYDVPKSFEMYLLNGEGKSPWGRFTAADGFQGEMWSPIVGGRILEIYAEMDEGEWGEFATGFRVTRVNVGYRGVGAALGEARGGGARSNACHTDVACALADPFCEHVKSALCYTIFGSGICSGSLLNNTAQDGRALVYTAEHCGPQNAPGSTRFYFNFQNATCRAPGSPESGGAGTCGSISGGGFPCNTDTILGATTLVSYQPADSVLLEMSSVPPDSFEAVYAGWNAEETPPTPTAIEPAFGIHHPGVEEKRIAVERDSIVRTVADINSGGLIQVWGVDFDVGGLEGGSSGSPLFDPLGRVIGTATGVNQLTDPCDQFQGYGRLEHVWDEVEAFRLALDPVGSGTTEMLGLAQFFADTAPETFGFELVQPSNGATGQPVTLSLVWNGACYTDDYRVIVSPNSNLSAPVLDQMVAAPTTSLVVPPETLENATTYYWQVQAINTIGTVAASPSISSFTTVVPPVPQPFSLVSPSNGAMDVETGPVLDWTDSTNAAEYLVEVDDSPAFSSPIVSETVDASARASVLDLPDGTLAHDTQYFWRVTASNFSGSEVSSPSLSGFRTEEAPPPLCSCIGNLDADCDTDVFDFNIFAFAFGSTGLDPFTGGDLDGDGDVDVFDFNIFAPDFGCVDN